MKDQNKENFVIVVTEINIILDTFGNINKIRQAKYFYLWVGCFEIPLRLLWLNKLDVPISIQENYVFSADL